MWEIILDALIDSAITIPFLLVIHLLIEFLEHNGKARERTVKLLNGKCAPLIAGGVGLVPQCGFSVMATDLYCQNYLKLGTLIAFFVATSDEALPLLLAQTVSDSTLLWTVLIVLASKLVYAVLLGYVINAFDKRQLQQDYQIHDEEGCCHHNVNHKEHNFWHFAKHPLLHTLKIFVYIFAVNAVFGLLLNSFEDDIIAFTSTLGVCQCFLTAGLGLVPNCASSVIITGMFVNGVIDLPALLAGLVANSGVAFVVLFKEKNQLWRNVMIVAIMYLAGIVLSMFAHLVLTII